jgi:Tol biopolymer transport system component
MVVDGVEGQGFSEIQRPVFSPEGAHLAYQARAGDRWHLVVDGTVSEGRKSRPLAIEFSGDSTRIAFIEEADDQGFGRLVVSDLSFKAPVVVDLNSSELVVSNDRGRAAVVSQSGGQSQVVSFAFERPSEARRGPKFDALSQAAFGPDGRALAYLGERAGQASMVLEDREEPLPQGEYFGQPVVRPDGKAVGIFVLSGGSVRLHQSFLPVGRGEVAPGSGEGLAYSRDGVHAFAASRGERWFVVVDGKEGPPFERVVTPQFSPDGKFVVYRARQDGRRFVVVADLTGKTVRQHPPYEQVFPVRFTADGKSVAYGVKDGPRLEWKVEPL